ncbi:MAG: RCC1 domain-containing protein, partial [Ignavibacteriaceae bacterium]
MTKLFLASWVMVLFLCPVKIAYAQNIATESISYSSYNIDLSGNLYTWGDNTYGQLGIGDTTQQNIPVKVILPSGVTSWMTVAGGSNHSLAIGSDGNLYAWGYNAFGQLGIGNTTNQSTPVKVPLPSGVTSWTKVAAGWYHSLAIGSDGNLYAWGYNAYGQLGIGNTTQQNSPVKVPLPSGVTSWTSVVSGWSHCLAIGNDGNLYAWGDNANGQLGIGNTTQQNTPVKVPLPSGVTSWTAMAGGWFHSLAIGNDGNLYAWGDNAYGQLGIGNMTQQNTPVKVPLPSGVTSWTAMAGGWFHSLAIGSDGNLYTWGYNAYGQLGIGNTTQQNTPVKVPLPSGVTSWMKLTAGSSHSLAISSDSSFYTWGDNTYGQLGIGNTTQQNTPVKVTFPTIPLPSGVTSWSALVAGWYHSLAIGSEGNLYTWGDNTYGQLGIGNTTQQNIPVKVPLPSGVTGWMAVAGGSSHSLAIGSDSNLYAWGDNTYGQLGIGNTTNQSSPIKVPLPSGVTSWTVVVAGSSYSLAIGSDGNLYAWGFNGYGQLGIGNTTNQSTPVKVPLPSGVTSWTVVVVGSSHSLAIGSDGNLYAWGYNGYGQLGIGDTTNQSSPVKVPLPNGVTSWKALAGGWNHTLSIGSDGNLYAWGDNTYSQLGIGNTTQQNTPVKVTLPSGVTSWTAVVSGWFHSLAIGSDGSIYTWGYNGYGQLGIGNTTNQSTPAKVPLPNGVTSWKAMAGGAYYSLAMGSDSNF